MKSIKGLAMFNIAVIEDSEDISLGIKLYLEKRDLQVCLFNNIINAKKEFLNIIDNIDLFVLDINLPDGNGKDFFKFIKAKKDVPVIFLTVKNDEHDVIGAFDLGADDYITKPFQLSILYARIIAVLRRSKKGINNNKEFIAGNYKLDKKQKRLFKNNEEIELSPNEYKLLEVFIQNANQTLTREKLLELIWDSNEKFVSDNTLTATIKRLRKKLDENMLKTIHGIGYRLEI